MCTFKDDNTSFCIILRSLSWILFILLLILRSIHWYESLLTKLRFEKNIHQNTLFCRIHISCYFCKCIYFTTFFWHKSETWLSKLSLWPNFTPYSFLQLLLFISKPLIFLLMELLELTSKWHLLVFPLKKLNHLNNMLAACSKEFSYLLSFCIFYLSYFHPLSALTHVVLPSV